jgi:hypothetical protein
MKKILLLILFSFTFLNCDGGSNSNTPTDNSSSISILEFSFVPQSITVEPGETVFILNDDTIPHHILSQSAEDAFDDTSLFDSLEIPVDGVGYITIPEDAVVGDTLFYYSSTLEGDMLTPNGSIVIE